VASASLNQTPLDWDHNSVNILQTIHAARQLEVSVLCFPELCITGYGCEDMFFSAHVAKRALEVLNGLVPATKDMIVAVGLPVFYEEFLYNAVCLMVDGKIAGFVAKQNLANKGVYYEARWFKAWLAGAVTELTIAEKKYPFGDVAFDCSGVRIGFEICEDAWVTLRTGINLAKRNVDLILNPSASHFSFGKTLVRKKFIEEGAKQFMVGYIYANLLGNEAGRLIYDGDTLIAEGTRWLAEGPRFSFKDRILTTATIDLQNLRLQRNNSQHDRVDGVIYHSFKMDAVATLKSEHKEHQQTALSKEEEFSLVVALGLFDYLRKSQALGFVLNLSGGADSAACVCLVYLMVHLSLQELGEISFRKKMSHLFKNDTNFKKDPKEKYYVKNILYCLYQKTQNNTEVTWHAAYTLTQAVGAPLFNLSIDFFVKNYCQLIEAIIDRPLRWEEDDLSLQNIQSRVRGPGAWLLANVKQFILLTTSNRSEAAVGYVTMDGDTCGGLSPLAGVHKSFILQWLYWLETKGFSGIAPLSVLREVTQQQPTAELRPISELQTDENDLMPYIWLDAIEQLFVRNKYSPLEILLQLKKQYPKESENILARYIEQFFVYWAQSQWKRERLAPSFHLEDENVDPKTWCRFPILSGGFKHELSQMWDYVHQYSKVNY
jgi:NAD+ synthase (glutamine-hydrolysing)